MSNLRQKVLVIGVGNAMRCDDGAGPALAQAILERAIPGVRVVIHSGEGTALMSAWEGADSVVILDAASSGRPPGTIIRFDASETPIPSQFFNYSTHAFSVAEAVEMARVLDTLPRRVILYGIEGADFGGGETLSEPVRQAFSDLLDQALQDIVILAQRDAPKETHHA